MRINQLLTISLLCGVASSSLATTRIAILDFELNDITSLPNTTAELQRTATMAPLLHDRLSQISGYQTLKIPDAAQKTANASFGYLFHFPQIAAQLAQRYGADWVVVSQHSKPSFLFSYLRVCLVKIKHPQIVARYDIELKGNHSKVTERAIAALSKRIQATLTVQEHEK